MMMIIFNFYIDEFIFVINRVKFNCRSKYRIHCIFFPSVIILILTQYYKNVFINETLLSGRIWLFKDMAFNQYLQYIAWVLLPVSLITFAAGFVHLVAPQSIGTQLQIYKLSSYKILKWSIFCYV